MRVEHLDHFVLKVADVDAAIKFYENGIGHALDQLRRRAQGADLRQLEDQPAPGSATTEPACTAAAAGFRRSVLECFNADRGSSCASRALRRRHRSRTRAAQRRARPHHVGLFPRSRRQPDRGFELHRLSRMRDTAPACRDHPLNAQAPEPFIEFIAVAECAESFNKLPVRRAYTETRFVGLAESGRMHAGRVANVIGCAQHCDSRNVDRAFQRWRWRRMSVLFR